MVILKRI